MAAKFEIKKSKNSKPVYFNFKSAKGIASKKKNATKGDRYERKSGKFGQPYFVLKAANGESIGRSETYASARFVANGMASANKNAPELMI